MDFAAQVALSIVVSVIRLSTSSGRSFEGIACGMLEGTASIMVVPERRYAGELSTYRHLYHKMIPSHVLEADVWQLLPGRICLRNNGSVGYTKDRRRRVKPASKGTSTLFESPEKRVRVGATLMISEHTDDQALERRLSGAIFDKFSCLVHGAPDGKSVYLFILAAERMILGTVNFYICLAASPNQLHAGSGRGGKCARQAQPRCGYCQRNQRRFSWAPERKIFICM